MSNLDPFTQKLIQRTQARKDARLLLLKRQQGECENVGKVDSDCISPVSHNDNSSSNERHSHLLQTQARITHDNDNVNKKRQSSSTAEDLDCSLEKKSKGSNSSLSTSTQDETLCAENVNENCKSPQNVIEICKSPIQKVTVTKTCIPEIAKPSLANRLNKLNKLYTEKLEVDAEEEKRQKEAEALLASRKKQQEENRAQAIQERIFGKGYTAQVEDERIRELKKKYLGVDQDTTLQPVTQQSVVPNIVRRDIDIKPSCARSESFCLAILGKEDADDTGDCDTKKNNTVARKRSQIIENGNTVDERDKMMGIEEGDGNIISGDKKLSRKPEVKPKPAVQLRPVGRSSVKNSGDNVGEQFESEGTCSVKDKKSIFEEKMREEAMAKKRERGCKFVNVNIASVPTGHCDSKELDTLIAKIGHSKTHLVESRESCVRNVMATEETPMQVNDEVEQVDEKISLQGDDTVGREGSIKPCLEVGATVSEINGDFKPINSTPVKPIECLIETPSKNYTGVNSPQPVDCTEDTVFCDTNAFDVSSCLQIDAHREEAQAHMKQERCHSNRCSTMKVEPSHLAFVNKALPELNMTPIQNESADEEMLSEFAKAIRNKVKDIKTSTQKQRLDAIDMKIKGIYDLEGKMETDGETKTNDVHEKIEEETKTSEVHDKIDVEQKQKGVSDMETDQRAVNTRPKKSKAKGGVKCPVKPPRSNKENVIKTDSVANDFDNLVYPTEQKRHGSVNVKESHYSAESPDVISKPNDKYARKKMRKSSSFSEGQSMTPVKSGYHRELSERYNACASFDKPDIVYSRKVQIQNLLEEAACQQNIVLQASQALNVAECSNADKSNSPEVIEGERLLLLATERRTVCLEEVKVLKVEEEAEKKMLEENGNQPLLKQSDIIPPCNATLALTDIKLPLQREFVHSLKVRKSEFDMFHFVLITSAGYKNIQSTKVVSCYDEIKDCALSMKSNIVMKGVPHEFTLTMKVFGMHSGRSSEQIAKVKRNANSQSSPGNLKNLFSKRNKEEEYTYHASPQTVFRTSNFKLVGQVKVKWSLFGTGSTKYALTNVPTNCPIEGCIQFRANCKPEYSANVSGFLTILEDVGGYTTWNRRWCIMKDDKVLYWRYPDDEKDKEPLGSIDLRYCNDKVIKVLPRDICARPHTFELTLKRATVSSDCPNLITTVDSKGTRIKYWVSCDNKDDRISWMDTINKQISDSRAWRLKKIAPKSDGWVHQE